jgi:hypothetical protein
MIRTRFEKENQMTVSRSLKAFFCFAITLAVVGCGGAEKPAPPSAVPPAGSGSGTSPSVNPDPAAKVVTEAAKPAEAAKAPEAAKPAEAPKAPEAKPAEAPKAPELKKPS